MTGKKYKFNVINDFGHEESYTGIFYDDDLDKKCPKDAYTKALEWFDKYGKDLIRQKRNLVFRECLTNGDTLEEELPDNSV